LLKGDVYTKPEVFESIPKQQLKEVKRLVEEHRIRAVLVEVPSVVGIKLYKMPGTSIIDYHMPIYDPKNYEKFLLYTAKVLSRINPKGRYLEKAEKVCEEVERIVRSCRKLNVNAVADVPPDQYAVSWIGVKVVGVLIRRPGLPVLPSDYERVKRLVESGEVGLVVVTNSTGEKFLEELARNRGIPVLKIPSPLSDESFLDRIREVSREEVFKPKSTPGFVCPLLAIPIALRVVRWFRY